MQAISANKQLSILLPLDCSARQRLLQFLSQGVIPRNERPPPPQLLAVAPSTILDSRDKDFNGYTLVEFMDYQCPPCRSYRPFLEATVQHYSGNLRISVRHLPQPYHNLARKAAIFAESSREMGRFSQANGYLYSKELTDLSLSLDFPKEVLTRSEKQISLDMSLAKKLKISATPTFLLVTPDKSVYRLSHPNQVWSFLK